MKTLAITTVALVILLYGVYSTINQFIDLAFNTSTLIVEHMK